MLAAAILAVAAFMRNHGRSRGTNHAKDRLLIINDCEVRFDFDSGSILII